MNAKKFGIGSIAACILIFAALLAGFYTAYRRMEIEADNHKAEIVMDWAQISARAIKEDVPEEEILRQFLPYITGILIKEPTVYDLSNEGRAVIMGGDELMLQGLYGNYIGIDNIKRNHRYVLFYDEEDALRALASAATKTTAAYCELFTFDGYYVLATSLTKNDLTGLGIGFDSKVLELLKAYDLGVAVQVRNFDNLNQESIEASVRVLENQRIIAVGFNDTMVPGADREAAEWSGIKKSWANTLQKLGAPLLSVEFFTQKGVESLSQAMSPAVVRMHSISEAEMKVAETVEGAPQRYQLATSERNIKIAFVRMLPGKDIEESVQFVAEVRNAIAAKGTEVGAVGIPQALHLSAPLLLLLIAGVCAGGWLLADKFRFGKWAAILALLAFAGGAGLVLIGRITLAQKLFAFCSVCVFPTLAVIYFQPEQPLPLGKAVLRIVGTCLVSLIGAVLMTGLLGDSLFMLKIDGFMGVKLAHIVPVALVLFFWFFLRDRNRAPLAKLSDTLHYKISIGFALIALIAFAVMLIYVSRTGNEAAPVSGVEKWLRTFLDQTLYVRPRTKEFLLGYPCLLIMYYYGYRDWLLPVMALAVIGQVSLVNTYAHIHTPIVYALLRSANGFWLGMVIALIGIAAIGLAVKIFRKYRGKLQQNEDN